MDNATIPIEMIDGAAAVRIGNKAIPLVFLGNKIHQQGPHWYFKEAIEAPFNFYFIELFTQNGHSAAHIYDKSMNYVTNNFDNLKKDISEHFKNYYAPVFQELWKTMVCGKNVLESTILHDLKVLGKGSRIELGRFVRDHVLVRDHVTTLDSVPSLPSVFNREAVQSLFEANLLAAQIDAMSKDMLVMPSPFGKHNNVSTKGMLFKQNDYYQFYAYYFKDSINGMTYYVVCGDWNYRILALFVPEIGHTLFLTDEQKKFFDVSAHQTVRDAIYEHVIDHYEDLFRYMFVDRCNPIIRVWYWHLGHHLWNELTGLQQTVAALPAESLPSVLVVSPSTSEMYGKIEALFPQFAGKVNRSIHSAGQLPSYLYQNGHLMLHPTYNYISQKLADRILELSADACDFGLKAKILALRRDGYRIVLIGLRVENRTLVDLAEFCSNVIEALKVDLGRVAVVFDGHNRPSQGDSSNGEFRSLHDHISLKRPIDVEHGIYETLKTVFAEEDNIRLISTIGEPISRSVFWCQHADFYVTPWGAGLAKYKWVCNKPGLIVSNQFFLGNQESHLYDKDNYRERPEKTFRVSQQDVQDFPEADLVIPFRDPLRSNFEVRLQGIRRELHTLVRYVAGRQTAQTQA